jgi:hypothetical protein
MHPAILALGTHLVLQASDHIPSFHIERTCKALSNKPVGKRSDQQADNECVSAEKLAQQQLGPIWSSYSATIRARCTGDTIALGMNSYLDLLVCLQMTDAAVPNPGSGLKRTPGKKPPG